MELVKPAAMDRDVPRGVVGGAEVSQATTGAHNIYMAIFRVPAGAAVAAALPRQLRERALHARGVDRDQFGDKLEESLTVEAGEMLYVPPRETHTVQNVSDSDPAEYIVARDSPTEDSVEVPWAEM